MPARSKVVGLPDAVREELNQRLIGGGFRDYSALTEYLQAQGFEISRSSVYRYGQRLEQQIESIRVATEQARALAEACPDDENFVLDAANRLAEHLIYTTLLKVDEEDLEKPKLEDINKLVRALADLGRSSISLRRWQAELREKLTKAAEKSDELLREAGVDEKTAALIRAQFLGIAP